MQCQSCTRQLTRESTSAIKPIYCRFCVEGNMNRKDRRQFKDHNRTSYKYKEKLHKLLNEREQQSPTS